MLKIAQIGNRPQGSVSDVIRAASMGFVKAGHTVSHIFIGGPVDPQVGMGFPGEFVSYADLPNQRGKRVNARQLRRTLLQGRYDVIITHRYHPCKVAAQACCGLSLKRKIAVFHGLDNFKRRRRKLFARLFLRRWRVAGVSQAVARDVLLSGAGFKANQVHVVSNGLDRKVLAAVQLSRPAARRQLGLPPEDFIFGTIGRLSDSKNQEALIEAYARIVTQLPPSRLIIIGAGRRQEALSALVAKYGLQDRVVLTGFIPKAYRYLKAFDLFLFPSRSEAFGLALLEAMATRVPVVVSNVGGIRELVGPYAFMIRPDDIQSLASQMRAMATKPARERGQIARGLYDRAVSGFSIAKLEKAYLSIIT